MIGANVWSIDPTIRYWPKAEPAPVPPPTARNRAARRASAKPKARPKWAGRSCLGPPICFRETYDGTPFSAQALGKASVGPHHVRNAMRRVRQGRAA